MSDRMTDRDQTQDPVEDQRPMMPWFEPRTSDDPNRTWPAVPSRGMAQQPTPEDVAALGLDPTTVPTYRPASFVDAQLVGHRRITNYPARIGSLAPARMTPLVTPPPAPATTPIYGQDFIDPFASGGSPPGPIEAEIATQFAPATFGIARPVVRSTPLPIPSTPSDPSPIRQRAAKKTDRPLPKRYPDWEIERHQLQVAQTGWQQGDTRCRKCHAYDRVVLKTPEHPILNFLCMGCQNEVYARARRYTIGERNAMYMAIEKWIAAPIRRAIGAGR